MIVPRVTDRTTLWDLAVLFLRLGTMAFGGPAAHVAMMRDEVVGRRQWLNEERFLDLVSATNLIPGPNSTELAIHIGWERRRWAGLWVAGLAFIVPAMLLAGACGWGYVRYGKLPAATWLLYGVKPVILGVIVQALWKLGPSALKTTTLRVLAGAAAAMVASGANELVVLFGAGAVMVAFERRSAASLLLPLAPAATVGLGQLVSLPAVFWLFLKTGSVLFGSGYVLVSFLRADLVERLHWLTEAQLLDAVAVGQLTPGPVFTTATFIGYLLAGPTGALVATAGIFLPAFVFVALSGPLVPRLRGSASTAVFLDGVNVASLALMAVVTALLARSTLVDLPSAALGLVASFLLVRFKINSSWLILGGAATGFVIHA